MFLNLLYGCKLTSLYSYQYIFNNVISFFIYFYIEHSLVILIKKSDIIMNMYNFDNNYLNINYKIINY